MTGLGHAKPQGQNRTIQASRDSSCKGQRCHYAIIWSLSPGMSLQPDVQASDPHGALRLQWHGGFEQLSVKGKGSLPARSRVTTWRGHNDRSLLFLHSREAGETPSHTIVCFISLSESGSVREAIAAAQPDTLTSISVGQAWEETWMALCAMALLACILSI